MADSLTLQIFRVGSWRAVSTQSLAQHPQLREIPCALATELSKLADGLGKKNCRVQRLALVTLRQIENKVCFPKGTRRPAEAPRRAAAFPRACSALMVACSVLILLEAVTTWIVRRV